jgi:hypothetical protein
MVIGRPSFTRLVVEPARRIEPLELSERSTHLEAGASQLQAAGVADPVRVALGISNAIRQASDGGNGPVGNKSVERKEQLA